MTIFIDDALLRVYADLNRRSDFPAAWCRTAAMAVTRDLGYKFCGGWFVMDSVCNSDGDLHWDYLFEPHCWNEDHQGRIIDLTAHQFNFGLREPLREGVTVAEPGTALFRRYVPGLSLKEMKARYPAVARI